MVTRAQAIFEEKFTLTRNLADLYQGLAERQKTLLARQVPPTSPVLRVRLNLLMPEYESEVLAAHINSVRVQDYQDVEAYLIVDTGTAGKYRREIEGALAASPVAITLVEIDFFRYAICPGITTRRRVGEVLQELLLACSDDHALVTVAPNESLFSNHVSVLAGALRRDPTVDCAATAAVLIDADVPVHAIHELIDFGHVNRAGPPGYGRFMLRLASIPADIHTALPYLDGRPMAVLIGERTIAQQLPATIAINIQSEYPPRTWDDAAENEVIRDFSPGAFKLSTGFGPRPVLTYPAPPAQASAELTLFQFVRRLFNRRWVGTQIEAIRKHGLVARLVIFKRKLGL